MEWHYGTLSPCSKEEEEAMKRMQVESSDESFSAI
jgi:hypothetical protein